jgi:hypothetical protein
MKTRLISCLFGFALLNGILLNCSKDDPEPSTGKLQGNVSDIETNGGLADVSIIIFNADDNSPAGTTLKTDGSGSFAVNLAPGNYFLKFYKQGYEPVPPPGMEAVSFTVERGVTTDQSAEMTLSEVLNGGYISGKITSGSSGLGGVLVVAEDPVNQRAFSSATDEDGNYVIYNVPQGSYSVNGYRSGYSSAVVTASVSANTEAKNVNVTLTAGASGKMTGTIRNLATDNKDVDVTLVHPLTKETIPGLTTTSVNLAYTIENIPDGTFIARATFKNDDRVVDPDRIAKFGEPEISVSNGSNVELTFDVTGSIKVTSPTNEFISNKPVDVNSVTPTFEWIAYSSTSDYVIEVIDASTGAVVWGGFDKTGASPTKNILIPSSQKSIVFNADGSANITELVPGRIYRWRVFASKNDQNSPTGWTLISASEDQLGLIKITE